MDFWTQGKREWDEWKIGIDLFMLVMVLSADEDSQTRVCKCIIWYTDDIKGFYLGEIKTSLIYINFEDDTR